VYEELVLEGPTDAIDVTEIVNRRSARVDARLQRGDRRLA
jgi:predicted transcriptional regulator